jgi:hypothetical protein
MTRYVASILMLAALFAGVLHADEKADKLRDLHAKFSDKVVVLTWSSTTSAMGQTIESQGSTTGLLLGKGGLVLISNQAMANPAGGMANMFGRGGESTGPENFKLHTADGKEFTATEALESTDLNLRWYGSPEVAGAIAFPEKAVAPRIGDEVVVIGAYDGTLNYARFFHVARINAIIEEGKYYGLDGELADCLGGVVLTLDGQVLGVVHQKKGKEEAGGGGIGRLLGGLNDPSKALGHRILITPATFAEEQKKAQEVVLKPDFGKVAATPTPDVKEPTPTTGGFEGTVASAKYRDQTKDVYVLIDVKEGQQAPEIDAVLSILDKDGKQVSELKISRRYHSDPMNNQSPIDQIGGFIADPEKKLVIEAGMKVVIPPAKQPSEPTSGWRGIERFSKMGEDVLKDNFGGIKVGFSVSQIPEKGSKTRDAGLKSGDVIYKVGDKEVTAEMTLQEFLKLLNDSKGEVKLSIVRKGGEKVEVAIPE